MSLKVYDLQCSRSHVFEGWFAGDQGFDDQQQRGLLSCPMCGDTTITRKLSAPRINLGRSAGPVPAEEAAHEQAPAGSQPVMAAGASSLARVQAEILRQAREMVRASENVGARFAEEALKIHRGEADERSIRGTATPGERQELAEAGVPVMAVPAFLDDDQLQ